MMFFLILVVTLADGFLLDKNHNSSNNIQPTNLYLTVSEFYDERKILRKEVDRLKQDNIQLRKETDKSLTLLASQIQQRFDAFEQTMLSNNGTTQNITLLLDQYSALKQKYNILKHDNEMLLSKYSYIEKELLSVKNKSIEYSKEIQSVKNLSNVRPLQDISDLKQTVLTISTKIQSLSINEQARNQDFLALYNLTLNLKTNKENLQYNGEKVSMMSYCHSDGNTSGIVKFSKIRYTSGINDTSSFVNTGQFSCEQDGLYLVSVMLSTHTPRGHFCINVNRRNVGSFVTSEYSSDNSVSTVVFVDLHVKDTLWVSVNPPMYIHCTHSQLTILQIS